MRKIIYSLSFILLVVVCYSQQPLQYQSMYVPKSNQHIMNEVVIGQKLIVNALYRSKNNYLVGNYSKAIKLSKEAEVYSCDYLSRSNAYALYLMGKCYLKLNNPKKGKELIDFARKYGAKTDKQVFNLINEYHEVYFGSNNRY